MAEGCRLERRGEKGEVGGERRIGVRWGGGEGRGGWQK
jgi:hypothetical protein